MAANEVVFTDLGSNRANATPITELGDVAMVRANIASGAIPSHWLTPDQGSVLSHRVKAVRVLLDLAAGRFPSKVTT